MANTFSIVNNVGALNALNRLAGSGKGLSKTLERLNHRLGAFGDCL